MERTERLRAVLAGLALACLFEALTVFATQDKAVRAESPWQDDPYDVAVSLAQFAVPMLAAVIALRLLAWRAPGGPDRERQTVRAAGAMTALVGITLAFEWAAVGAVRRSWGAWTWVLVGGLAVTSVCAVVVAVMLARCRGPRVRWRHDWLGDVLLVASRTPVVRRWAAPGAADWVRRHAMGVFVLASALAAVGIVGAMAVGEHWTDPGLIAWVLAVEFTSHLAFCLIANAVAGFVARPERPWTRRAGEASLVAGCVAVQLAVAFRDALWPGTVTSVADAAALTFGAGAATTAVAGVLLMTKGRQWQR